MSLQEVVCKLRDCATESNKNNGVVAIAVTGGVLSDKDISCVSRGNLTKNSYKGDVTVLTEDEKKVILDESLSLVGIKNMIAKIIEDRVYVGKLNKDVNSSDRSWNIKIEDMNRMEGLDRKR